MNDLTPIGVVTAKVVKAQQEAQQEARAFIATPAGAALTRYESLLGRAWVADCKNGMSERRLREIWDESDAARKDLIAEIKKLQDKA